MYRILMTRTTSGEVVVNKEITGYTRAYSTFVEMCDERSYYIQENHMEGTYYGGGHGYDYFIELSAIDSDDSGEQTQYEPF
jgi:hypothetical protein